MKKSCRLFLVLATSLVIFILLVICFSLNSQNYDEYNEEMFSYVESSKKDTNLTSSSRRNVIIVLGSSGEAKTLFINNLNEAQLISQQINGNQPGDYVAIDYPYFTSLRSDNQSDHEFIKVSGEFIVKKFANIKMLIFCHGENLQTSKFQANLLKNVKYLLEFTSEIFGQDFERYLLVRNSIGLICAETCVNMVTNSIKLLQNESVLTTSQQSILNHLMATNQIGIIQNIHEMFHNKETFMMFGHLNFIQVENSKVDENYDKLLSFINNEYFKPIENYIELAIADHIERNIVMNKTEIIKIYSVRLFDLLRSIQSYTTEELDYDYLLFACLSSGALNSNQQNKILSQNKNLLFLIQLLPPNIQNNFSLDKRRWISAEFNRKLKLLYEKFEKYFHVQVDAYKKYIATNMEFCANEYFTKGLLNANYTKDLTQLENDLHDLLNLNEEFEGSFWSYLLKFYDECSIDNARFAPMEAVVYYLKYYDLYSFDQVYLIDKSLNSKLYKILEKIDRYRIVNKPIWNDGVLTMTGYFVKISEVLDTIINNSYVVDLEMVRIYSMNSVIFDRDFKIPSNKYKSKTPDLYIFAPRIIVEKRFKVDLSCEHAPTRYPDDIEDAYDGDENWPHGLNGRNGLPGYNGGNFLLVADSVSGYYLDFISTGSKGGPGQNGI